MKSCGKGEIRRKAYSRKTPSGKKINVKSACIKSRSVLNVKRKDVNKEIMKITKSKQKTASKRTTRVKSCPKGSIKRSAYTRSSYVKKSGARVSKTYVAEGCIKDLGKKGKGTPAIGPLIKGSLKEFGYENVRSLLKRERRNALEKAIKEYGSLSVLKKLNAVYVLNKNTNKDLAEIYINDRNWVMKNY